MKIFYTMVLLIAVILSSIEFSSQFECLPNGAAIPGVPRCGFSYFADENYSPLSYRSPPAIPPVRERSRAPPAKPAHKTRNRFPPKPANFEVIKHIRLIPNANPNRIFEFRKYTFPADTPIQLRGGARTPNAFLPMPTDAKNVLSTSNGVILAILEGTRYLRGIYALNGKRVGIKMESGEVAELTSQEIHETPLGGRRPIAKNFNIVRVNQV